METKTKNNAVDFHAVDFMRQVRSELTEQFFQDKEKYFDYLKQAMDNFKMRQRKQRESNSE